MRNSNFFFAIIILLGFVLTSCNTKKSKSDIDITFTKDTLQIGYTYWWAESGPFMGNCGDELSLVFVGTLTGLNEVTDDAGPLYRSQKGFIEIEQIFKIKDLGDNTYANQKTITTDCFDGLGVRHGDKVIAFCYDYEGKYTIPGDRSIIKIKGFDDPIIKSIRSYIDNDQNPLVLKKDIGLWASYGLNEALEQIIACKNILDDKK